ncbi:TIR domain-containing protein [Neorhizobium galegae]|uniref:TIR domain-containing protein n=1 Tax=Neorhizobium galegae TaxID=399 RepID=A0A6A1TPU9_NEOGA|nr:TIR domain-containing protein [Neorhizobium galegae]KAB1086468.1 TIR domain-containing protein [Neorhizobium galegae]
MKVFVGYAKEDKDAADQIVAFLETLGIEVWFDKKSLIAGDDWDSERLAAQRNADLIIHLCSEQILSRTGVVNREIRETMRLADDKPFGSTFVIFVRVGDVRLPAAFMRYHYIDFDDGWQQAISLAVGKKAGQIQQAPIPQAAFKRDNVSVTDGVSKHLIEEKDDTYELLIEYIEFGSRERYWRLVSSHIEAKVLDHYYDFKASVSQMDEDERNREYFRPWEYQVTTQEFYRYDEFISIRYFIYMDFGGAHGNHRTLTSNFFTSTFGSVEIRDFLENDDAKAKKVLAYCLKVVEAGLDEPQQWQIDVEDMEQVWNALGDFNFDSRGLTFNFSPYVILSYAAGDHEAHMPWAVASNYIAEKYANHWYSINTRAR